MKFRLLICCAFTLATAIFLAGVSVQSTRAQNASNAKPKCIGCSLDGKTTPRTADGHTDLSGLWNNGLVGGSFAKSADGSGFFDFGGGPRDPDAARLNLGPPQNPNQPSYKPEYAARVKAIVDAQYGATTAEDPQMDCKPLGVPRVTLLLGFGMQIVQSPDVIVMMYETNTGDNTRLIYMDGRAHPTNFDTSYMGHSIGHWEGDVLVVDTVGLSDETWLGAGQIAPKFAVLHSDKEHVIERYTRTGDILKYEATVEDPVMFEKPWVVTPRNFRHAGANDYFLQTFCQPLDKEHLIKPTPEDQYICNYCAPGAKPEDAQQ